MRTYVVPLTYLIVLSFFVQFISCSSDKEDPTASTITGISPETGPAGAMVTITGNGFSSTPAENVVKFNGVEAVVFAASTTELVVGAPANGTTGVVTVTIGSEVLTGPTFTYTQPTYFIKFKMNGVTKIYGASEPGYSACGDCSCNYLPPLNDSDYAGIDICQNSSVTAAMIQNLNGKTIAFSEAVNFPQAFFYLTVSNVNYGTDYVSQTAGMNLNITSVVADGALFTAQAYKVAGTFSCKVAKPDGSQPTDITEGTFVVRYTEDF